MSIVDVFQDAQIIALFPECLATVLEISDFS